MAGLNRTLRNVRPCDECGIAKERHAPAGHHRRFEIADRLEKWLCASPHDLRKDRREHRLGIAPQRGNHLVADQLGRYSLRMDAARGVGLHLCERGGGIDRAVPDEAVTSAARSQIVEGAGHRITEDVLAIQETPSEAMEDSGMCGGPERGFLNRTAPGDVAGVD